MCYLLGRLGTGTTNPSHGGWYFPFPHMTGPWENERGRNVRIVMEDALSMTPPLTGRHIKKERQGRSINHPQSVQSAVRGTVGVQVYLVSHVNNVFTSFY